MCIEQQTEIKIRINKKGDNKKKNIENKMTNVFVSTKNKKKINNRKNKVV